MADRIFTTGLDTGLYVDPKTIVPNPLTRPGAYRMASGLMETAELDAVDSISTRSEDHYQLWVDDGFKWQTNVPADEVDNRVRFYKAQGFDTRVGMETFTAYEGPVFSRDRTLFTRQKDSA